MIKLAFATVVAVAISSSASAATYTVDALANSSDTNVGLPTAGFVAGETLYVRANPNDLWSAGVLPRWSNADGLSRDLFATGSDESGEPAGTLIGENYGLHDIGSFAAPVGALVGEIGGVYRLLGTKFTGQAWATGTLNLYFWDLGGDDNAGSVDVTVANTVPEPSNWAMMIAGFGLVGAAARQRRRNGVTA